MAPTYDTLIEINIEIIVIKLKIIKLSFISFFSSPKITIK